MYEFGNTAHSLYQRTSDEAMASDSWFILQATLLLLGFSPTTCQLSVPEVLCHSPLHSGSHNFVGIFELLSPPLLSFVLFMFS